MKTVLGGEAGGTLGGGVLEVDRAGVRGGQEGGPLAHGPGLESGTDHPSGAMHLHMANACILICSVLLPEESVLGGAAVKAIYALAVVGV